jgi:predicted enzyme related to lactoylglutathione lyase
VDPVSGYRRYHRAQIRDARLIQALRGLDLPIEDVRRILHTGTDAQLVLAAHRDKLERQRRALASRISSVDHFLEEGIPMPTVQTGCRPVQIGIGVKDVDASIAFYRDAFDFPYDVIRRTKQRDHFGFSFGEYGRDDFFLFLLLGPNRSDRPQGPWNIGIGTNDVETTHANALSAGATEIVPPSGSRSAIRDPNGNWIGLERSDVNAPRPVQIKLAVDDESAAKAFYRAAFGTYSTEDFAVEFVAGEDRFDRPGPSGFSYLVEDLDTFHTRALEAGGTEVIAPRTAEGMPRHSTFKDPSGNTIGLAQG